MQSILKRVKPLLRWGIVGAALFFLARVLQNHWESVLAIQVDQAGWACLAIALGVTLLAHICAGWVWSQILRRDFRQSVEPVGLIQAYLQTNVAKYLPGNIWHYYGRVTAATQAGATLSAATVSVVLEPLLMAAAALLVTFLGSSAIAARFGFIALVGQWLVLVGILLGLHPKILNPIIQRLTSLKQGATQPSSALSGLDHYPFRALLGEMGFLLLRGAGFLLTFWAISSFRLDQFPLLLSAFSLAWVLGLVVPGAPGGIGIFEATAIALLNQTFSPGVLFAVVALYRLISVASEALGAGLSWFDQRL